MRETRTSASICLDDGMGFVYRVAEIEYLLREDGSYAYTFTPNYSVIELLPAELFQGIPGLDLGLRLPRYSRENMTPVFISERTPSENREELWKLLEDCGMEYLDRLEWLVRTKTRYGGDRLYARRLSEKRSIAYFDICAGEKRAADIMRRLLSELCLGNDVAAGDFAINDGSRKAFYSLLMSLYTKEKGFIREQQANGARAAAENGRYRGRSPAQIDDTKLEETISAYESRRLSADEAANALGISRRTFFRRLRERRM